jgi:hypothetical protein
MKNKSTTAWIIIGVTLAIVGIVVLLIIYSKKDINWQEHYSKNSKDPYGLFLIKELLKDEYGDKTEIIIKSLHKDLPVDTTKIGNNYMFIGSKLYLNNIDQEALFTFVKNGNTAFIATKELPYSISYLLKHGGLFEFDSTEHSIIYPITTTPATVITTIDTTYSYIDTLYSESSSSSSYPDSLYADTENHSVDPPVEEEHEEDFFDEDNELDSIDTIKIDSVVADTNIAGLSYIDDKEVHITLFKPLANSPKEYVYKNPKVGIGKDTVSPYHWLGIYGDSQLHVSCVVLSKLCSDNRDSMNTLISIPYGKGMLYVYTTPMLFTNFQLKETKTFNHAKQILSVLSPGKLYWDEVSGLQNYSDGPDSPTAYLKYILSIEALRWAWYLLLSTTIIYILFESKRKQRIIPVIETITNTSIEYVHTTGRLYAQIGNHRKLVQLNMRLFLSSIQQKYGISVNLEDTDSIQWLAAKSGIPAERYEALQLDYKRITVPGHDMKTKDLHTFYKNMQFIYQKLHN